MSRPFAVLNPGGRDARQEFPDGAGSPDTGAHPPVNFHAYAACVGGTFERRDQDIGPETPCVLLLLRRDLKGARQAMLELRRADKAVAISFKEAGGAQLAEMLADPGVLRGFRELCERSAGAIATTPESVPLYRGAGARFVEYLPTPYPVEDPRWDFSIPLEQRQGIFLGTREWRVPARNHAAALLTLRPLVEAMGQPVTVINEDGGRGRKLLAQLRYPEGLLRVVEGRRPYPEYLRLIASHRLVFQLDVGAVPGQVAGDALLCRVPCVGGNGATERTVWPELCGHGREPEALFDLAVSLLEHGDDVERVVARALERAQAHLSFAAGARGLEGFFGRALR